MNRIVRTCRMAGVMLMALAVTGSGAIVKVPADAVTTTIKLRADKEKIPIELRWADGFVKTIVLQPCDAKGMAAGKVIAMTNAGFEFKGLNLQVFVRPNLTLYNAKLRKEYQEGWDKLPEIYGNDFMLCVRQDGSGVEFLVNGNHAGRLEHVGRLNEVAGPLAESQITFDRTKADPRFVQLDIGYLNNPGSMKDAAVKLSDDKIPFVSPGSANLDLGVTASHMALYPNTYTDSGYTGRNAFDNARDSYLFTVPSAQYARAWVLCAAEDASSDTPAFNVRLTRFVPNSAYGGRSRDAIADTAVNLPGENAVRVGEVAVGGKTLPLWRVEAFLKTGEILDLITHPCTNGYKYGRAGLTFGPYLDFELTGKLFEQRPAFDDNRMYPNPAFKSSIHVFGVTLEKAGADLVLTQSSQPGNIFYNDEAPEMKAAVNVNIPGEYELVWTIRDDTGKKVGGGDAKTAANKEIAIDLRQKQLGWYEIVFELFDGSRKLVSHTGSFALLPPDTRKATVADSPYGTWNFGASHYSEGNMNIIGPLFLKAGFRHATGLDVNKKSEKDYAKWKLTAHTALSANRVTMSDAQLKEKLADMAQRYPHANSVLTFYEGAGGNIYQIAPELVGEKSTNTWPDADARWECANQIGRVVSSNFPQMKILLGNTLASTELAAEVMRRGIPQNYFDYFGTEVVGRSALPERQWEGSLQAAELLRETGRKMGYAKPVTSCQESNYRLEDLIGEDNQAHWYVRDILLMHAFQFPNINLAIISDAGNSYAGSFWGKAGITRRAPFLYPKKAFVGIATATRVLDQVKMSKIVPTGSRSVYALEMARSDGKLVYPLWTSRGTAELKIKLADPICEIVDFYGRESKVEVKEHSLDLTVDVAPKYLVVQKPLENIACGQRNYPGELPPADLKVVNAMDKAAEWELAKDKEPLLEKTSGVVLPFRTLGAYAMRQVSDSAKGECIELELAKPDLTLNELYYEYAVLRLKEPVILPGKANTVGIWVNGNSGWGQVFWEIEDAKGRRGISCGTPIYGADVFDYDGRVSICFDGWKFVSFPITSQSAIPDLSTGSICNLWNFGANMTEDELKRVSAELAYPLKLKGVVFAAQSRPLFLTERAPHKQVVRFKDVSVAGGQDKN